MNKVYEKNISLIKKRHPQLFKKLEKIDENDNPFLIKSIISKEGLITFEVTKDGKTIPLHSRISPTKEIQNLCKRNLNKNEDAVFVMGFGAGYLIKEIINSIDDVELYVFEPSLHLLKNVLKHIDVTDLLSYKRLFIFPEKDIIDDSIFTEKIPVNPKLLSLNSYKKIFEAFYKKLQTSFNTFIQKNSINTATLKRFDRLWTKNTFKNSLYLFSNPGINTVKGLAEGLACIVIAAGPSIENDIEKIIRLSKMGYVIISVDTALKPLLEKSLIPDFVVSVDPQFINSLFLNPGFYSNIKKEKLPILVSDPAVHSSTLKNYPGKIILTSSVFPPGKIVERFSGEKGYIAAGGSVSVAAFDLARILGCDPIVIAGLDLSYKNDRTHLRGSFIDTYRNIKSNKLFPILNFIAEYMKSGAPFKTRNNKGEICYTDRRMLLYHSWFERNALISDSVIINSTNEGLPLTGIDYKSIDSILKQNKKYDKKKLLQNIEEIFSKYKFNKDGFEKFKKYLITLNSNIEKLKNTAELAINYINKNKNLTNSPDFNKKLNLYDNKIMSFRDEIKIISMTMQKIVTDILKDGEIEKGKLIEKSLELYNSIIDSCNFLKKMIKITMNKLKKSIC